MYGIKVNYSPVYPQANGMAKAMNKVIVGNMWRNLEDKKMSLVRRITKGFVGSEDNEEESDGWIPICSSIRDINSSPYRSWIADSDYYGCR